MLLKPHCTISSAYGLRHKRTRNLKGICSKHWKIASQKTKLVRCKCVCVLKCMPHLKRATSRRWNFAGYPHACENWCYHIWSHYEKLFSEFHKLTTTTTTTNFNNNWRYHDISKAYCTTSLEENYFTLNLKDVISKPLLNR